MGDVTPAIFLLRKCYKCKSRTPHLTTGKANDPRWCWYCLNDLLVRLNNSRALDD